MEAVAQVVLIVEAVAQVVLVVEAVAQVVLVVEAVAQVVLVVEIPWCSDLAHRAQAHCAHVRAHLGDLREAGYVQPWLRDLVAALLFDQRLVTVWMERALWQAAV